MSREIKFRGKNSKNEWVCGHYAELATQGDYLTTSIIDNGFVNVVNPETLCQYTGLADKNGTEIYEGDVILIHEQNFIVKYFEGGFCLFESNDKDAWMHEDWQDLRAYAWAGEVIGNIHDHQHLMEE